jgi:hypothetical protein
MPKDPDRDLRRRELEELRRSSLSVRARLESERRASASGEAEPVGGAAKDPPGPSERKVLPSLFDQEEPAPRPPRAIPASPAGKASSAAGTAPPGAGPNLPAAGTALPMVSPPPSAPVPALPMVGGMPQTGPMFAAPRRPRLLVVPALTLVAGLALGFAAGSARAGGERATSARTRPPAARPASLPSTAAAPRPAASCLEAAKRGDQVIAMLITNQRRKAAELLKPYTTASQQCRSDAGR